MRNKNEDKVDKKVLVVLCVAILLRLFVVETVYVKGPSMEPNFHHGDIVALHKVGLKAFDYGDVLVCRIDENGEKKNIIKRVVGLPGDTIEFSSTQVNDRTFYTLVRNGEEIEEDYAKESMTGIGNMNYPLTVPEGKCFVMGDNRNQSLDSRKKVIGLVADDTIKGKVVFRLYPFDGFGKI